MQQTGGNIANFNIHDVKLLYLSPETYYESRLFLERLAMIWWYKIIISKLLKIRNISLMKFEVESNHSDTIYDVKSLYLSSEKYTSHACSWSASP